MNLAYVSLINSIIKFVGYWSMVIIVFWAGYKIGKEKNKNKVIKK